MSDALKSGVKSVKLEMNVTAPLRATEEEEAQVLEKLKHMSSDEIIGSITGAKGRHK